MRIILNILTVFPLIIAGCESSLGKANEVDICLLGMMFIYALVFNPETREFIKNIRKVKK